MIITIIMINDFQIIINQIFKSLLKFLSHVEINEFLKSEIFN